MPWRPGGIPRVNVARPAGVVVGKAASTGDCSRIAAPMVGSSSRCCSTCCQPIPSTTSTTAWEISGNPSRFSKPASPSAAAIDGSTSAIERWPYLGGRDSSMSAQPRCRDFRQGCCKRCCTHNDVGSISSLTHANREVIIAAGTAVSVIGFAIRVTAACRFKVNSGYRSPANREHEFLEWSTFLVPLGLTDDTGDNNRINLLQPNGFRGCRCVRHSTCFIRGVFIRVAHDQPRRRQRKHGHMSMELIAVEGRFVLDEVRHKFLACERGIKCINNKRRVVAGLFDVALQGLVGLDHGAILPRFAWSRIRRATAPDRLA